MKLRLFTILFGLVILFSALPVLAAECDFNTNPTPGATGTPLCNPLERPGGDSANPTPPAGNLVEFFTKVVFILSGFALLLPIVAVAYGGFSMIISQGNPEAVMKAKSTILWAVSGFVMAILSFVIITATINLINANNIPDPLSAPKNAVQNPLRDSDFVAFVIGLLINVLNITGIIALLFIIINGFRYITSAGNEEQATQAKSGLTWSVAGIIVITLSYVIIKAAAAIFGIS